MNRSSHFTIAIYIATIAKFDDIRPNSGLLRSQSHLDFDYEQSGRRTGAGQRQTDFFPNSECFLGGGPFPNEGDILPQRSGRRNEPRGPKTARQVAVFDPGEPLSGGSVIGVPRFVRPIMTNGDGLRTMVMSVKDRVEIH